MQYSTIYYHSIIESDVRIMYLHLDTITGDLLPVWTAD